MSRMQWEEGVNRTDSRHRQSSGNCRTNSSTLHLYFVEDMGLTPGESARARTADVAVVISR